MTSFPIDYCEAPARGAASASAKAGKLTSTALKERGWTDALIRDFAPRPDELVTNPAYKSGPPMRLWYRARIEQIESTPEFIVRREKVLAKRPTRQAKAQATVAKKKAELIAEVAAWTPTVVLPDGDLVDAACKNYNNLERSWRNGNYASPNSDPEFLARIIDNYVRHCCTDYEDILCTIRGRVGTTEAYAEIRAIVDAKVSDAVSDAICRAKAVTP